MFKWNLKSALKEVVEGSGNKNVVILKLDLSDTKSIKEFAEVINRGRTLVVGVGQADARLNSRWVYPPLSRAVCSQTAYS